KPSQVMSPVLNMTTPTTSLSTTIVDTNQYYTSKYGRIAILTGDNYAAFSSTCRTALPYKLAYSTPPCGPCETNALSWGGGGITQRGAFCQSFGEELLEPFHTTKEVD